MAIEKLFFSIKQDRMIEASRLSEQSTNLLKEGRLGEADAKIGEAKREIERAKAIDNLVPQILERLSAAGITQPSEDYLKYIVGIQIQALEEGKKAQEQHETQVSPVKPTESEPVSEPQVNSFPAKDVQRADEASKPTPTSKITSVSKNTTEKPVNNTQRKERKQSLEIAPSVRPIAYALFEINKERNDFANKTLEEITEKTYKNELDTIQNPTERQARVKKLSGAVRMSRGLISKRLGLIDENSQLPESMKSFLEWVKTQPEYSSLSTAQLSLIASGKISFDELKITNHPSQNVSTEPVRYTAEDVTLKNIDLSLTADELEINPMLLEFTKADTYQLAKKLQDEDVMTRIGINIHGDDEAEVKRIITSLLAEYDEEELQKNDEQSIKLETKLKVYFQDKQKVFMANLENDDTQYLLALISGVDSNDRIRAIIE